MFPIELVLSVPGQESYQRLCTRLVFRPQLLKSHERPAAVSHSQASREESTVHPGHSPPDNRTLVAKTSLSGHRSLLLLFCRRRSGCAMSSLLASKSQLLRNDLDSGVRYFKFTRSRSSTVSPLRAALSATVHAKSAEGSSGASL